MPALTAKRGLKNCDNVKTGVAHHFQPRLPRELDLVESQKNAASQLSDNHGFSIPTTRRI